MGNCVNDMSYTDDYGDCCLWYNEFQEECGKWDRENVMLGDATAMESCCICQYYAEPENFAWYEGCDDTPSYTDDFGETCDFYNSNQGACGLFDIENEAAGNLTAMDACCVCNNGPKWYESCQDDPSYTDDDGDGCIDYYNHNPVDCGYYDYLTNVSALESCCVCQYYNNPDNFSWYDECDDEPTYTDDAGYGCEYYNANQD